jgi:hypothetical protein
MLFLAICVMLLCLYVTFRNVRKEATHRQAPSGSGGGSDIGARGIHTEEGREVFLAAPLRTTSDHGSSHGRGSAGSEGSDDEEVVTFARAGTSFQRDSGNAGPAAAAGRVATSKAGPTQGSGYNVSRSAAPATAAGNTDAAGGAKVGAGRGAALMRRHEGAQFQRAAAASVENRAPQKVVQTPDVEEGGSASSAGGGDKRNENDFEEADL